MARRNQAQRCAANGFLYWTDRAPGNEKNGPITLFPEIRRDAVDQDSSTRSTRRAKSGHDPAIPKWYANGHGAWLKMGRLRVAALQAA